MYVYRHIYICIWTSIYLYIYIFVRCVSVCVCAASERARVRVRLGAHASAPTRASAFPPAWTAGGSARRHSPRRRRSTRTSARGTPRRSPRCPLYAPPFPARAARQRRQDARGGVVGAARAVVRGGTADARARACAQTCGRAHARVPTCVRIAARSRDGLYACVYMYV